MTLKRMIDAEKICADQLFQRKSASAYCKNASAFCNKNAVAVKTIPTAPHRSGKQHKKLLVFIGRGERI